MNEENREPNLGGYGDVVDQLEHGMKLLKAMLKPERSPKKMEEAKEWLRGMKRLFDGYEWTEEEDREKELYLKKLAEQEKERRILNFGSPRYQEPTQTMSLMDLHAWRNK